MKLERVAEYIRALERSNLRKEIFRMLSRMHPNGSHPAEIAREINATISNVICALGGFARYTDSYSLVSLELVDVEEVKGQRYYKLSPKGLEVARTLQGKI